MFEESSRPLKIFLLVLFVVALAVLVFIILGQYGLVGEKAVAPATPSQSQTEAVAVPPTGEQKSAGSSGQTVDPSSYIPMEEAQKQFKAIQDQVSAGTLSQEDAQKQMNTLSTKIAPPPIPPEIKKQMEEAAKKAGQTLQE